MPEHKAKDASGFTKKYGVDRLVWFRSFSEVTTAIHFEKQLKRWRREWKVRLIEAENLDWHDLYPGMMAVPAGPLTEFMGPGLSLRENRDDRES